MARAERYDLILMDISMPEMDGIEATRHIRAEGASRQSPIVGFTANLQPADHARALAAGALDPQVVFSQEDNQVNNDIDGNVFFEATVTATAWGRPLRKILQA